MTAGSHHLTPDGDGHDPLVRGSVRRIAIRPDFPELARSVQPAEHSLETIEKELKKRGRSLEDVGAVHIAYPQKHPGLFPGHRNAAILCATDMQARLAALRPDIGWILETGLYETVHLDRSGTQTSLHALTARQFYVTDAAPRSGDEARFFSAPDAGADGRKPCFIIVDQSTEQGTTVANMMSHIHDKGGFVLAAFAGRGPLAQRACTDYAVKRAGLSAAFNDAACNGARLPEIALALADSARYTESGPVAPDDALRMLDRKLARHGHSVFALTNGECERLIQSIRGDFSISVGTGRYLPFSVLMAALDQAPVAVPPPFSPSFPPLLPCPGVPFSGGPA